MMLSFSFSIVASISWASNIWIRSRSSEEMGSLQRIKKSAGFLMFRATICLWQTTWQTFWEATLPSSHAALGWISSDWASYDSYAYNVVSSMIHRPELHVALASPYPTRDASPDMHDNFKKNNFVPGSSSREAPWPGGGNWSVERPSLRGYVKNRGCLTTHIRQFRHQILRKKTWICRVQ